MIILRNNGGCSYFTAKAGKFIRFFQKMEDTQEELCYKQK